MTATGLSEHVERNVPIRAPAEGVAFEEWIGVTSVYDAIRKTAEVYPLKTAISFIENAGDIEPRRLSYAGLLEGITRVANAVRALGLGRGDAIAYLLPSLPETHLVLWGAETAASALPLNPLLKIEELAGLCKAAGVRALVALGPTQGTDFWQKAVSLKELLPDTEWLIQVGGDPCTGRAGVLQLSELLRAQPAHLVFDTPGLDDIAAHFHTGGTTGTPKLAAHTQRNQLAAAFGGACGLALGPDDVSVNGAPMFHVGGTICCSLSYFIAGAEVIILTASGFRNPDVVANYWRILERTGATIGGGVPTAMSAVLKIDPAGANLSRLRLNTSGAALMPRSVAEEIERITGKPTREIYGMTECGGVITVTPIDADRVLGSAGRAIPFCELQVRALVNGEVTSTSCESGCAGVLVVRGPNVTPGYRDPGQSRSLFTPDGWLITGDVARVEQDGHVFITGRSKDLIIRSGHNIDPAVVEDCILRDPGVVAAAAVGMPDAYAGEVPVVYVTRRAGAAVTADELIELSRQHLEPPAVPRKVFFVETFPTTAVGKVSKFALRCDAAERHLRELLRAESLASLVVSEESGRGLVASVGLGEGGPGANDARKRIETALRPYLLSIAWIDQPSVSV